MPAIEPERLARLRAVVPPGDFLALLELLRTDLAERRGVLLAALEKEDRSTLREQGHAIAGMAANAGAETLCALARELEAMAVHATRPLLGAAILEILREERAVQQALTALAGTGAG